MLKLRFIFGYGRARICALRVCGAPLFLLHDFVIRTSYFVIQNACTGHTSPKDLGHVDLRLTIGD